MNSNVYKLVMLGDTGVGKSSLITRYVNKKLNPEAAKSTIGASFTKCQVDLSNSRRVSFEIWDTAGQERFRCLTPFYYRNAEAAIVVYSVGHYDTFAQAKKWIEELRSQLDHGQQAVIALVGNQVDMPTREVSSAEADEYAVANDLLFLETSALNGFNVDELFHAIGEKVTKAVRLVRHDNIRLKRRDYSRPMITRIGQHGPLSSRPVESCCM